MLKHQIIIGLAVIAVAVWIVFRIRENKRNNNGESETEE
jgi:heme/copper-type cytochrome/quinol oxidase subunit 2